MKRGHSETGHNVSKKPKIELRGMYQTVVGQGRNIDHRFATYFLQYSYVAINLLWLFTSSSKK